MTFEEFQHKTKLTNYYPYSITLNLTNACNLACRYCFVHQKPDFMTLDIAKAGIDFIYNNLQKHKNELKDIPETQKCVITLFGGEPLLTFNSVIKPLYEYMEEKYGYYDNFVSQITTNGLLINQEITDFLKKYEINILFSFDGMKKIQDENRPCHNQKQSSYDTIMNNFRNYIFNNSDIRYELRATADLQHIDLWYDNFLFFNSLPIPEFSFVIEFYTILDKLQIEKIHQQLSKMCDYTFDICLHDNLMNYPKWINYDHCLGQIIHHDYEQLIRIDDLSINTVPRFLTNFCGYSLEYVAMDAFGNFYPCREDPAEYTERCHPTMIGNVKTGINYKKVQELKDFVDKLEYNFFYSKTCDQDCWYAKNNIRCEYAECPSHAFREKDISISFCSINSFICNRIVYDMDLLINQYQVKDYINYLKIMFPEYKFVNDVLSAPPPLQNILLEKMRKEKLIT